MISRNELKEEHMSRESHTAIVSGERLKRHVKLLGEMMMDQARLHQAARMVNSRKSQLETIGHAEGMDYLTEVTADFHQQARKLRMMTPDQLMHSYPRIVDDLSHAFGGGAGIEEEELSALDRSLIEDIGASINQLIRMGANFNRETQTFQYVGASPEAGAASKRYDGIVAVPSPMASSIDKRTYLTYEPRLHEKQHAE
ncbi:hypothetical protein [Paenibacillus radicis (ex Gao et al. 2016)]|uniref:Uncharacterized protein n=1 Tax=Paenibacillus radicis (ex Gao et al. 2016) TaxID=1737354 RepID=A0A917LQR8_9BACL|nr:hypothetical protein [Paenibacillus radicis (ex Gao et al. 2016)]GGG52380.1 hypothetical protein GCM10010918_01350 [Paenibacillus radicis (ex Gao et al. 2016)]